MGNNTENSKNIIIGIGEVGTNTINRMRKMRVSKYLLLWLSLFFFNICFASCRNQKAEKVEQGDRMEVGELIILALETLLASLCLKVISVFITVILYGRMIEIYLYSSIGAIPFATMSNREWGQIGSNYLRGLFALAFQGFFIMVCVGIYSVLVANIQVSDNVHTALLSVMAYTVILCFSLMKTANFSKSIFNAH